MPFAGAHRVALGLRPARSRRCRGSDGGTALNSNRAVTARANVLESTKRRSLMALDVLSPPADRFRLHPVEPRRAAIFCFALLTMSCALASFALACATPFAAFAVI